MHQYNNVISCAHSLLCCYYCTMASWHGGKAQLESRKCMHWLDRNQETTKEVDVFIEVVLGSGVHSMHAIDMWLT